MPCTTCPEPPAGWERKVPLVYDGDSALPMTFATTSGARYRVEHRGQTIFVRESDAQELRARGFRDANEAELDQLRRSARAGAGTVLGNASSTAEVHVRPDTGGAPQASKQVDVDSAAEERARKRRTRVRREAG